MQFTTVLRHLGLMSLLFSLALLPPDLVARVYGDEGSTPFLAAFVLVAGLGLAMWLPTRRSAGHFGTREGLMVAAGSWAVLALGSAVPFMLAQHPHMTLSNAVFEAVSGLTTTGATVLTGIDELPPSILFYRQELQWLGGMGIVVLAVAVLPALRIGGMQLYLAEMPGPLKEERLVPRIADTAKVLWLIYLALTALCTLAFWLAGMDLFDAVGHAFATLSTGGFSTHDASLAWFRSPLIEGIAILFMTLGGINFALHYTVFRRRSPLAYWRDAEVRTYLLVLLVIGLFSALYLRLSGTTGESLQALRMGMFQTVSFMTTTGFTTESVAAWPGLLPLLMISISFIGGCGGSTGGGMKVMRVMLLTKQGLREITRSVHRRGVLPIRLGRQVVPHSVSDSIWGFVAVYLIVFYLLVLALTATGLDFTTAFSGVVACINNLGPGLGQVAAEFSGVNDAAKWILSLAMILGRLEVFTLLVLLSPVFWRS